MHCVQVLQYMHNCMKSNRHGRRLYYLFSSLCQKITWSLVIFQRSGRVANLESFPGPAESLIQKKSNWFHKSTYTLEGLTSMPITRTCSCLLFSFSDSCWNTVTEIRQTSFLYKILLYVQGITLITDLFITSACLLCLSPVTEINFSLSPKSNSQRPLFIIKIPIFSSAWEVGRLL